MNTLHNVIPTQLNSCIINTFCCVCVWCGNKKPIKFGSPSVTCRPQTIPFRTRKGSQMSPRHPPVPLSPPNHVLGTSQYHHCVSVCCARKTCSKLSYTENKKEKKGRHISSQTNKIRWCLHYSQLRTSSGVVEQLSHRHPAFVL